MDPQIPSIKALPANVVAQIKSSAAITNLNGVVLELLKNSLDADAWIVTITVDFQRGGCVVEDNGCGIPPTEFQEDGGLVKLHRMTLMKIPEPTSFLFLTSCRHIEVQLPTRNVWPQGVVSCIPGVASFGDHNVPS